MWECPRCGKCFPRAGQGHSCVVVSLDHHFSGRPRARELFDALLEAIQEEGGPIRLSIAKTRIGIITQLTFAAVMPRREFLRAHILLRRRVDSPRFVQITDGPPYWVHVFEVRQVCDIDVDLRRWLRESYQLGSQPRR